METLAGVFCTGDFSCSCHGWSLECQSSEGKGYLRAHVCLKIYPCVAVELPFEKDARVSANIPEAMYEALCNQPLTQRISGDVPLHITAPYYILGTVDEGCWCREVRCDEWALKQFYPAEESGLQLPVGVRLALVPRPFYLYPPSCVPTSHPRVEVFCILLGYARDPTGSARREDVISDECVLLVTKAGSSETENRYTRVGLMRFCHIDLRLLWGDSKDYRKEVDLPETCSDHPKRTTFFDDAPVKEFILV